MSRRSSRAIWCIPLVLLASATLIFTLIPAIDLGIARAFYGGDGTWPLVCSRFAAACYGLGPKVGLAVAIPGLLGWLASWSIPELRRNRRTLGFLALAAIVGPYLLTNVVFKQNWGRPRPRDLYTFGGELEFVPVAIPGFAVEATSFPSGHATMAFFPMALFFVYAGRRWWRAWLWLAAGLTTGTIVGVSRMMEGAHFASDIVWSAAFVWFPAWWLACRLGVLPRTDLQRRLSWPRRFSPTGRPTDLLLPQPVAQSTRLSPRCTVRHTDSPS